MTRSYKSTIAELSLVALMACLGAVLFARFEVIASLHAFGHAHENWRLDELAGVFAGAALCLPLMMFLARRRSHLASMRAVHLAERVDHLTGLPNLLGLYGRMKEINAVAAHEAVYLVMIDLDRFKSVNDLRGHDAGDMILKGLADRLAQICGPGDQAFRAGGDDFAVLLTSAADAQAASRFAEAVVDRVAHPFGLADWTEVLSCSVGIARYDVDEPASEIVHRAEQAMTHAKQSRAESWAMFDEALGNALRGKALLETELRDAIKSDALVPFFQPILKIETGELTGFEVLARWLRPSGGFVPPDVFIPMAEELGLIDRLSDQLLAKCCQAMADWSPDLLLSFNLSPRQLNQPSLAPRIEAILEAHGISGRRLAIEITETAVFIDMDRARRVISQLRKLGIRVSLDDFGIGTSSLAVLSQLPFDTIKIDRSFISNIAENPQNAKIVRGVLALARSLELTVTAEGIESDEDLSFLRDNNCILGQGYFFSRPVPEDALPQLIADVNEAALVFRGEVTRMVPSRNTVVSKPTAPSAKRATS